MPELEPGTTSLAAEGEAATVRGPKGANEPLAVDGTGKFHGDLPGPADLAEYTTDELEQLRDSLESSVAKRIEVNSKLGPQGNHGLRQAQEQQLIRQIGRLLKDR